MKLIYSVLIRTFVFFTIIIALWATLFYFAIIDEINDEVDDSLEDYSELIIMRALSGKTLPSNDNGSNNQYYLQPVTNEYASTHPNLTYCDSLIYITEKRETEPARILTTIFKNHEGQFFQLVVATPTFEKDDLIETIGTYMIILYIALLLCLLFVEIIVFIRNMRPLYKLLNWIDNFTVGVHGKPLVNPTSITEFRQLNDAVLRSAERSEMLFEQQKRFIGDASHEMQTPIAICINRLEMLIDDENMTEKQIEELGKVYETLSYLTKLNKSLLLLSKIDNGQFTDIESVSFADTANKLVNALSEVYTERTIIVDFATDFIVKINSTLSTMLVTNLIKNAFAHSQKGDTIYISTTANMFKVGNNAHNGPLDGEKIFERFHHDRRNENSTGLGLSISQAICRAQNLDIEYVYINEQHNFIVSIKKF